jgi:hypothetical protein
VPKVCLDIAALTSFYQQHTAEKREGRRERARAQGSLAPRIISFKRDYFHFFILLFASVQT